MVLRCMVINYEGGIKIGKCVIKIAIRDQFTSLYQMFIKLIDN